MLGIIMSIKEGRLSRWSRLKQLGGASEEEEARQNHNSEPNDEPDYETQVFQAGDAESDYSGTSDSLYRKKATHWY